jgi:hypothetical protein
MVGIAGGFSSMEVVAVCPSHPCTASRSITWSRHEEKTLPEKDQYHSPAARSTDLSSPYLSLDCSPSVFEYPVVTGRVTIQGGKKYFH